jgi:hypothetical protein
LLKKSLFFERARLQSRRKGSHINVALQAAEKLLVVALWD